MDELTSAINALNTGDLSQAESICLSIIDKFPQQVQALHLMGIVGINQGRPVKAVSYFKRAHALRPDDADILLNLGCSQLQSGRLQEAEESLRTVIGMRHDDAIAHSSLGNVLKRLERYEEAVSYHQRAVALEPLSAEAHSNLASTYLSCRMTDAAIEEYREAVCNQPDSAELHFNMGTSLQRGERFEDACKSFRKAITLNPDHVHANMNLGTSLRTLGRLNEAIACLKRSIELAPDSADAHWNLSLALLEKGDYADGWREYEWRLKIPDIPIRRFSQQQWDGSDQQGKTLLIHAEQGMGDTMQFVRFAAFARQKVGRVLLDCDESLVKILSGVSGVDQVLTTGQTLPDFDLQIPLLSMPGALSIRIEDIADFPPYLKADSVLVEEWRAKLNPDNFKVGLVWAGNQKHEDDHNRSCKLTEFDRLLKTPGVSFYSLQKDKPNTRLSCSLDEINLIDAGSELTDYADTAALINNLDLVITVDTAVAHLAGAMGKPVWTLLPFAPDWRWMLDREDTPWYPTMRLFRQSCFGDWDGVLVKVVDALIKCSALYTQSKLQH